MHEYSRRDLVKGIAAGVPIAVVLADPMLASAVAGELETVTITTAGGRSVEGTLAVPDSMPAPAVLLIHEWWGLNDQIKSMAAEFAKEGYLALALDLFGGKVAKSSDEARQLTSGLDQSAGEDTVRAWGRWLKSHENGTGKLATVGWCFGGGWSLMTSIVEPVDATVIYYGNVKRPAEALKNLKGPVLGNFATQDRFIDKDMVADFEAAMKEAGKTYTSYWYDANHGFANPTGGRYDEADTKRAWERTLAFLKANV